MTQQERLLDAFMIRGKVPLYHIITPRPIGLGIAQYGPRIDELRKQGYNIVNRRDKDRHTYYELIKENQGGLF